MWNTKIRINNKKLNKTIQSNNKQKISTNSWIPLYSNRVTFFFLRFLTNNKFCTGCFTRIYHYKNIRNQLKSFENLYVIINFWLCPFDITCFKVFRVRLKATLWPKPNFIIPFKLQPKQKLIFLVLHRWTDAFATTNVYYHPNCGTF